MLGCPVLHGMNPNFKKTWHRLCFMNLQHKKEMIAEFSKHSVCVIVYMPSFPHVLSSEEAESIEKRWLGDYILLAYWNVLFKILKITLLWKWIKFLHLLI